MSQDSKTLEVPWSVLGNTPRCNCGGGFMAFTEDRWVGATWLVARFECPSCGRVVQRSAEPPLDYDKQVEKALARKVTR